MFSRYFDRFDFSLLFYLTGWIVKLMIIPGFRREPKQILRRSAYADQQSRPASSLPTHLLGGPYRRRSIHGREELSDKAD
jgi:hypothetical protein